MDLTYEDFYPKILQDKSKHIDLSTICMFHCFDRVEIDIDR